MEYRQSFRLVAFSLIWALSATAPAADEKSPEEVLQGLGLHKSGRSYVLPDETALSKKLHEIEALRKKVTDAQQKANTADGLVDKKKQAIIDCIQLHHKYTVQLSSVTNVAQHNAIVAQMNELNDRVTVMEKSDKEEKDAKATRATATEISEQYVEQIIQLRKQYLVVKAKYDKVVANEQVKQAIEELNKDAEHPFKLGPSSSFVMLEKSLKKMEGVVLSEIIPMRRGDGGLWYLSASFNGQHACDLAMDSGCTSISLPYKVAVSLGLTPSDSDPTVPCELADGRTVDAKLVYADSVRVGNFTVSHVECTVMPENCPKASPLLGQSFIRHFTYKVDNAKGQLHLTQIEQSGSRTHQVVSHATPGDKPQPASEETAAGEKTEAAGKTEEGGKSTPEQVVTKLLKLDANTPAQTLPTGQDGVKFTSCKPEPVANLIKRLGDPDSMQKLPGSEKSNAAKKPWVLTYLTHHAKNLRFLVYIHDIPPLRLF